MLPAIGLRRIRVRNCLSGDARGRGTTRGRLAPRMTPEKQLYHSRPELELLGRPRLEPNRILPETLTGGIAP
jgi:hypothetical protein